MRRLLIILYLCVAANLVLFAWTAATTVAFPYDVNYGEGQIIDQARRLVAGQNIYQPRLDTPPYVVANYPPVYLLMLGTVASVLHLPLLLAGRMISLIATLGCAAIIQSVVSGLTGQRQAGLLAGGLLLANPLVTIWAARARVDMLALAFGLLGLWLLYRHWSSRWGLICALLCMAAAAYTRQSSLLAAPLAGTVWLWHKDRRRCLAMIAGFGALILATFAVLELTTDGGFSLHTITVNAASSYLPQRTITKVSTLVRVWPICLAIAFVGLAALAVIRSRHLPSMPKSRSEQFVMYGLAPYTVGAAIVAITVGKVGSDVNYFLELMAAVTIWVGNAWVQLPAWRLVRQPALALALVAQVLWGLSVNYAFYQVEIGERWRELAHYDAVYADIARAGLAGPVLADELMGMVVQAGQPVYFQPFDFRQLESAGLWSPDLLIGEIQAHKFPLIVIDRGERKPYADRWSPEVAAAIEASYVPYVDSGGLTIYRPSDPGTFLPDRP